MVLKLLFPLRLITFLQSIQGNKKMEKIDEIEKNIINHYELIWPLCKKFWHSDKTLGLHYGFYEKGIKNFEDAVINMNNLIERNLNLNTKTKNVLDAGCGVGGTSIYLAEKYPKIKFIGIELTPKLVDLAKNFAEEKKVENVEFFIKNYVSTDFSDNYFDCIFALLSSSHAVDKREFLHEMNRIIKPDGKLIVIDIFQNNKPFNFLTSKIYDSYLKTLSVKELVDINNFDKFLRNEGFENIKIHDISKNIQRHHFIGFILNIPSFFYFLIRKIFKYEDDLKANYLFTSAPIYAALISQSKNLKYFLISAYKK